MKQNLPEERTFNQMDRFVAIGSYVIIALFMAVIIVNLVLH